MGVNPNTYLSAGGNRFGELDPKFKCQNCLNCEGEDQDKPLPCCGCKSMDYYWGYKDIPYCESCNPDDGTWPGGVSSPLKTRGEAPAPNGTLPEEADYERTRLTKRSYGKATLLHKPAKVCGSRFSSYGRDYRYPAFPAAANYPWEGIQGGKWDSISRYWGNSSSVCSNWGVTNLARADVVNLGPMNGGVVRAKYQTEHVFEAQLISDFFNWWLDKGQVNKQQPVPTNPQRRVSCTDIDWYINTADPAFPWQLNGVPKPFIHLLLTEMGNMVHLDRLTVMLARPNRKKGSIFTGSQATDPTAYKKMKQEEQLQSVKDIGMIFNYLNTPSVWAAFCATFEAIDVHMGDFDTWSAANGVAATIPNLQQEWRNYMRVALDSIVLRNRASFDFMYSNRKYAHILHDGKTRTHTDRLPQVWGLGPVLGPALHVPLVLQLLVQPGKHPTLAGLQQPRPHHTLT